jgi:hypothetical protein
MFCCCPLPPVLLLITESDILDLLSSKLTVLRLTPEQMQSKAACATSLAMLNHAWQADLQVGSAPVFNCTGICWLRSVCLALTCLQLIANKRCLKPTCRVVSANGAPEPLH